MFVLKFMKKSIISDSFSLHQEKVLQKLKNYHFKVLSKINITKIYTNYFTQSYLQKKCKDT